VIDEINVSDEEIKEQTHKPSKRRIRSKKNDSNDLINLMKSSISIGNKSIPNTNLTAKNSDFPQFSSIFSILKKENAVLPFSPFILLQILTIFTQNYVIPTQTRPKTFQKSHFYFKIYLCILGLFSPAPFSFFLSEF
jgi:hypothetical protein